MFNAKWFFDLEKELKDKGLDSDKDSFDFIKNNLKNRKILNEQEFFESVSYVILAGGFSQITAKKKHLEILNYLLKNKFACLEDMLLIFNNKNKIKAILNIWENKKYYCNKYYSFNSIIDKLKFLQSLPHIGKITANHLARNLGENIVKYDIWIQRLGIKYVNNNNLKPDNKHLSKEVKEATDKMFNFLEQETHLPKGYIDVVLWKACQQGLINL